MNLLLRIINQNLSQCEETKNYSLEGGDYTVVMKVENSTLQDCLTPFEKVKEEYFANTETEEKRETVVGFVTGKNRVHPIHSYEVAYIVNDSGQTLERVYGQYRKH